MSCSLRDQIDRPSQTRSPILYALCSRDNQIEDQIEVLNRDYTGTGLKFNIVNTTRIENAEWFEKVGPKTPEQTAMKKRLRSGGPDILNVFTVSFDNRHGLLGYATLPFDYRNNPGDDGVVIRYSTLPGSILSPINLGRTLTHEVGHWVGLYHTFEGGSYGSGDYVSDTPSEAVPASGCPGKRDTCESEGFDRKFGPALTEVIRGAESLPSRLQLYGLYR